MTVEAHLILGFNGCWFEFEFRLRLFNIFVKAVAEIDFD